MSKPALIPRSRVKLNLLYSQGAKSKLPVMFLTWLVAYGRFIVIFVEIIVVAVFIARFKYDADLADLKDKINARLPYLESLSSDESRFRQTQLELSYVNTTYSLTPDWKQLLSQISKLAPQNVESISLNLEHKPDSADVDFSLTASANSNESMGVFLDGLKNDPNLKDINLGSVNFEEGSIKFSITGTWRKKAINN